ncbi:MAG: hypothetical protein NT169_11755 [Chloroflexi bacterium]|nr:hypothetical protein [Chloroflexota bacterium]
MSRRKTVLFLTLVTLIASVVGGPLAASAQAPSDAAKPPAALEQMEQFWQGLYGRPSDPARINPSFMPQATQPLPLGGKLLAKAQPDECFDGIGSPYPPGPPCATGRAKVNQSYVWGLTKTGNDLWFGTATNVQCAVIGRGLGVTTPFETNSWVCEFGSASYPSSLPADLKDWRPPRIYQYSTASETLTEKTPPDSRIAGTGGFRFAASHNNVVLLGGPAFGGSVNLFAYQADSGAYLGSINLPAYDNIRKSLVVNDVLYLGVGVAGGMGSVLRWTGDPGNPFQFETVGDIGGDVADLAFFEGRIFASTWPRSGELAGLFMSPVLTPGGLTAADAAGWTKVWQVDAYEPDPVTASTYYNGALMAFDGYLYWGTMHVPMQAAVAHFDTYGMPSDPSEILATILGTQRATNVFRGRHLGVASEIQLLYGYANLPAYDSTLGWKFVPNNMGRFPLFGLGGFNNFFNNYTWSMETFADQLFVGTMDWSYVFASIVESYLTSLGVADASALAHAIQLPTYSYGADLYRFVDEWWPAIAVSTAGVGNYTNYGVRNMVTGDGLYLGMANPMNLMTDPGDAKPEGGWELIGLYQAPGPMETGYVYIDQNGDGFRQDTEQTGLSGVWLTLEKTDHSLDATKSVNGDGWYQFDLVMPGQYTLKAQIPPDYVPTSPTEVAFAKWPLLDKSVNFGVQKKWAKLGDHVWYDANANGIMDVDEPGIGNVTVALLADNAGAPGATVATVTTADDGSYLFDGILPGTYWVKVTDTNGALANMTLTVGLNSHPSPYGPLTLANKQSYTDADFGYAFIPGAGQTVISDQVWVDTNGNGVMDGGEKGLAGIRVCAQPMGNTMWYCATTNSNGIYGILASAPRTYLVAVINPPAGMTSTHGFYVPLVLHAGERRIDVDFGYR